MSKRQRGVVLTDRGQKRLEAAIAAAQEAEKFGKRFTQAELSERANLSIRTIRKIREGSVPVDESSVKTLFNVFGLALETADYGQPESTPQEPEPQLATLVQRVTAKIDWGEKPDTALFFGRTEELETLSHWVMAEQCRVVTLLGMGGIGKTSLAAKLADQIYNQFDYVIWRSLREAPPLDEILVRLIQFLSDQQETEINLPTRLGERLIRLLHYLREHRCLLVLDNLESILQAESTGQFRDGYEGYGELIQHIGSTEHQSCLLLTSRECPRELAPMAGDRLPVRLWSVTGIDDAAGREILKTKGLDLKDTAGQSQKLIDRYSGNPQALHLVATAIQREFLGDVDDFLEEEGAAVEDVRTLLDQHLNRLAPLERSILFWLAINREPVELDELMEDLLPPVTKREVRSALRGLSDRYLIETVGKQFTLQNVIMEFVTDRFVEQVGQELGTFHFDLFHTHALIKATAKDYIRETQVRLILKPITTYFNELDDKVFRSLEAIRKNSTLLNGYAPGSILNLLCQRQVKVDCIDFSGLTLRQVYLRNKKLDAINLKDVLFVKPCLTQTFGNINAIAFNGNGELLAVGDSNSEIQLWKTKDSQHFATLQGHTNWILSVAFSHNNDFLASASRDKSVRLWNVQGKYSCDILAEYDDWVGSVDISPDNRYLICASLGSKKIELWDIQKRCRIYEFSGHAREVRSLAFSPCGYMFASGGGDDTVRVWDIQQKQCIYTFSGHTQRVNSVTFSPNGYFLASGANDNTVRIWDIWKERCLYVFEDHTDSLYSVAFSPDSNLVASGGWDKKIRVWSIQEGRCQYIFTGHTKVISAIAFSPDQKRLASGSTDNTVRIWDLNQRQCVNTFSGYTNRVLSVVFSPDGNYLFSGSEDGIARMWDVQQRKCCHEFSGQVGWIRTVAISSDGKFLASGSSDGSVRIWNVQQKKCCYRDESSTGQIFQVAFSPDNKTIAIGDHDEIKLWNFENNQYNYLLDRSRQRNSIWSLVFSPCGNFFVGSGSGHEIHIWNVKDRRYTHIPTMHVSGIDSVNFSPCGRFIATGGRDSIVRLWDTHSYQCLHVLAGHGDRVWSVTFSPCGRFLASGSEDMTIRLWDILKLTCVQTLRDHSNWVRSLAFQPEGQTLASSSNDGKIRLWDISTWSCSAILQVPRPYEGTDISRVRGLTEAQRASMIALGAVDRSSESSAADEFGSSTLS
ncbi:MAG: NB-ARC domain-containing protein [Leptolyngbyaceae cyanobacterium]